MVKRHTKATRSPVPLADGTVKNQERPGRCKTPLRVWLAEQAARIGRTDVDVRWREIARGRYPNRAVYDSLLAAAPEALRAEFIPHPTYKAK